MKKVTEKDLRDMDLRELLALKKDPKQRGVYYVDTGNLAPEAAKAFMQEVQNNFKTEIKHEEPEPKAED